MKRIFLIVALAFTALTLSANNITKTIGTNPATDMTLSETAGIYSLYGPSGVIVLGSRDATAKFLKESATVFVEENLHNVFGYGEDKFEVMKDDKGLYLIKVGFGGVKIRQSDIAYFSGAMLIEKGNRVIKAVKKELKK